MGTIYRRKLAAGNTDHCEDKRHGGTECCPACAARFGRVWWIKFYRGGKPFFESSRSTKKTDAENLLKSREGQVVDGRFVGTRGDKLRFETLAENLLNDYKANQRRSVGGVTRSKKRLAKFFEGRRAVDITTADVRAYIAERQAGVKDSAGKFLIEPAANATIQNELAALKRMFNLALQGGELHHKPHIPSVTVNNARKGFIGEIERLALREALPPALKPALDFAYETAWRKEEVFGLTWDRVDLTAGTVRLDTSKNSEGRTVILTESLKATLRRLREETTALEAKRLRTEVAKVEAQRLQGKTLEQAREQAAQRARVPWVFHRDGRRIRDFRKAWTTACATAKVAGLVFHDLRRSGIRNMVRAGVPQSVAMRISGHKTVSVFKRYDIVSEDDLREAALRVQRYNRTPVPVTETVTAPTLDPIPTSSEKTLL
jgi:integrase